MRVFENINTKKMIQRRARIFWYCGKITSRNPKEPCLCFAAYYANLIFVIIISLNVIDRISETLFYWCVLFHFLENIMEYFCTAFILQDTCQTLLTLRAAPFSIRRPFKTLPRNSHSAEVLPSKCQSPCHYLSVPSRAWGAAMIWWFFIT